MQDWTADFQGASHRVFTSFSGNNSAPLTPPPAKKSCWQPPTATKPTGGPCPDAFVPSFKLKPPAS